MSDVVSDKQIQILKLLCEMTSCKSLGELGDKVDLTEKQIEQQMKMLSRTGHLKEKWRGYFLTEKGRDAIKTSAEKPTLTPNQTTNSELYNNEAPHQYSNHTSTEKNEKFAHLSVKEIIRETKVVVKIRCSYCKNTFEEIYDNCPHCGAKN